MLDQMKNGNKVLIHNSHPIKSIYHYINCHSNKHSSWYDKVVSFTAYDFLFHVLVFYNSDQTEHLTASS